MFYKDSSGHGKAQSVFYSHCSFINTLSKYTHLITNHTQYTCILPDIRLFYSNYSRNQF